jgi:hypothetical protein
MKSSLPEQQPSVAAENLRDIELQLKTASGNLREGLLQARKVWRSTVARERWKAGLKKRADAALEHEK